MNMSKSMMVAVAAIFSVTAVGAAVSQPSQKQAGAQSGGDKVQTASNRHGKRDHGRKGSKGHRRGGGGLNQLIKTFDANEDGNVTQEEIISVRETKLTEFDANKDGSLDLSEYEALWLDAMRERMVDRFQKHDDDGDGSVTVEEFTEQFASIVERRDRNDDGVLNADDAKQPKGAKRGGGRHGGGKKR